MNTSFHNLILIPARSGSTRVKNKNLRELGGKPLLAHVIKNALASEAGRVVVSTNSKEIADVALKCGAEVPFMRPEALSTATSSSLSTILHALDWFKSEGKWTPEFISFCPPTNPFLNPMSLRKMVEMLQKHPERNSIVTVTEPKTHPFRIVKLHSDGKLENGIVEIDGKTINDIERSQDWPKVWENSPACRMSRTQYFYPMLSQKNWIEHSGKTYDVENAMGFAVPSLEAMDIDTEEDFEMAGRFFK